MTMPKIIEAYSKALSTSVDKGHNIEKKTTADKPDIASRYIGGARRTTQPFISGYWYFILIPPENIFNPDGGVDNTHDVQEWFHSTAESFTPPSKMLTMTDVPAMGGNASSFVTGAELTRTFTVAFREYQNTPIINALDTWTDTIMNPNLGISTLRDFIPSEYKGTAYAILTRPTMKNDAYEIDVNDIEKVYHFDGVVPESSPHDALAADISGHDGIQLSVTFRFDGWPITDIHTPVIAKAVKAMNDTGSMKSIRDPATGKLLY